jgi:hypothetical protein
VDQAAQTIGFRGLAKSTSAVGAGVVRTQIA